ncbi:MAG: efflux transporter outer membrane subunit [Parasulfuritortus sp.]|nr:efflux transporter outer membrane subunit [Parasulfuritortus sp.]
MPEICQNPGRLFSDRRVSTPRVMHMPTIMALLMLGLSGCASMTPRSVQPIAVETPATWSTTGISATNGSASLAQWWQRFDDPLLASLVTRSLQANTSVKKAQAALLQARALRDVAAAGLLPTVGSSASAQRNTSHNNSSNNFNAGLDASWELDVFGANRNALAASEANAQASAASLGEVQVSTAAEVALGYIDLRNAQTRLAIATDNLASQKETLQITQWRLQAGLVTSVEAEQARASAEQTAAQLPVLQTSIEQSEHALAVLTGQPPAALSAQLSATGPVPMAPDNLVLSFPAETLRQRPDVRAAELQVSAALARVSQADAARLPSFSIGGSLGLSALTLGTLTNGASVVSALLASVSLPVFDGGALLGQVHAQEAALEQARMDYQEAVLTALLEVEDALVALRGDRDQLQLLQNAAEAASNAAQLARQRYASGLVDFQTVLETQRTQLNTQDSVAGARATLSADHVRLYKALGGGWNPDGSDAMPLPSADITRKSRS